MSIALIDYGSGNLRSAAKAFERAVADLGRRDRVTVTADPGAVAAADRVVLPGVGAFADCRAGVTAIPGMMDALTESVIAKGRPFFGICVGMQLMADTGFEFGEHPGFGWIPGAVRALEPADAALKIPHMGWNGLRLPEAPHPLFRDVRPGDHAYFVHSYHFQPENTEHLLAETGYGGAVTAAVGRDNLVGTQFHPEKSQALGLKIISNFLEWQP